MQGFRIFMALMFEQGCRGIYDPSQPLVEVFVGFELHLPRLCGRAMLGFSPYQARQIGGLQDSRVALGFRALNLYVLG